MRFEMVHSRMRCRMLAKPNGDTRVIFDIPTEQQYLEPIMATVAALSVAQITAQTGSEADLPPVECTSTAESIPHRG